MCLQNDDNQTTCLLKAPVGLVQRESPDDSLPKYRTNFMRDRDRIMYSKSFRRLSGKTQVYLSGLDDHQRTRLTHTLEVSQIARTISTALGLDTDLTEAISLGHDLGHTPFGHVGERSLHAIMTGADEDKKPIGTHNPFINPNTFEYKEISNQLGFKHNLQSIKNAMRIEKNVQGKGLNLTNFTLFGMQAHSSATYKKDKCQRHDSLDHYNKLIEMGCMVTQGHEAWSFEALVVSEADEIAQIHHDLEDAIRGRLLTVQEVSELITENFAFFIRDDTTLNELKEITAEEAYITTMSKVIINLLVTNLIESTEKKMKNFMRAEKILSHEDFVNYVQKTKFEEIVDKKILSYDYVNHEKKFAKAVKHFQETISNIILYSHEIQKSDSKGRYVIRKLFQAYYTSPEQLPNHCFEEYFETLEIQINKKKLREEFSNKSYTAHSLQEKVILMRVICDYIAGMTDHYALERYRDLYE